MNSQSKGKRFERDLAKIINKKLGVNCRRTPQSGGMNFKGDLIDIDPNSIANRFHFEAKNQESLNIWNALKQAIRDCPLRKTPLVVFTRNFSDNYVTLRLSDFLDLLAELEEKEEMEIEA